MSGLVQLDAGKTVGGDFRVIEPLKHGGMGSVYVVEQLQTGARRALKLMHPQLVQDPKFRKRFEQEARIGAQIPSEHVVQVIAAGVDNSSGTAWLVMELLEGEDLDSHLRRRGHLPQAEATEVLGQLCHALAAAHSVGIVHRDLKPANIFLAVARRRGVPFTVKVLDFGIAKIVAEASTTATEAVGSPMWMAPEQTTQDHEILPATDVWALGLLTFRLLTGRYYWKAPNKPGATTAMLFREILIEPLPSAAQRAAEHGVAGLPKGFDAWFAKCVAREPEARFKNAGEAFAVLEKILAAPKPGATQAMDMLVWKDGKDPAKDPSRSKRREPEESSHRPSTARSSDQTPKKAPPSKQDVLSPVADLPPAREPRSVVRTDMERKGEATSQVPFGDLDESIQRASRPQGSLHEEVDERASTPPDLEEVMSAPDTVPARPATALEKVKRDSRTSRPPDESGEVKGRRSEPGAAPRARTSETPEPPKAKPVEPAAKPFVVKPPEPKPAEPKEAPKAKVVEPPPKPVETKEAPKAKPAEPPPKPPPLKTASSTPTDSHARERAKVVEPPPKPADTKAKVEPIDPSEAPTTKTAPPAKPTGVKPLVIGPVETEPLEAEPAEAKPIEAKPAEAKPLEAKPAEHKPLEAKPAEIKEPERPKPIEAPKPSESRPSLKSKLVDVLEELPDAPKTSGDIKRQSIAPVAPLSPAIPPPEPSGKGLFEAPMGEAKKAAIPSDPDTGTSETVSGVANTSPDVDLALRPGKKLGRIGAAAAGALGLLLIAVFGIRSYQQGQVERACEAETEPAASRIEACNNLCAAGSAAHCMTAGDIISAQPASPANKESAQAAYQAACNAGLQPACAKAASLNGAPEPTTGPAPSGTPSATPDTPIDIDVESAPVKHIVVMWAKSIGAPPSITRTQAQAQSRALEALNKLKAGAKFEDIMRQYSDDEPSKSRGGVPDAQMLGRIYAMAETMKPGDYIMVLTSVGYHVLFRTTNPFAPVGSPTGRKNPDSQGSSSGGEPGPSTTPSTTPSTPTTPTTTPVTTPSSTPSSPPSATPTAPPTENATGGGPPDELALKRQLEPSVYNGTASLDQMRMLKAICGHLGDMQCKAKATAAIAQKQSQAPSP